jgi:hypothetical protein
MTITNIEKVDGGAKYTGPCDKCGTPYSFVMATGGAYSINVTCPHCGAIPREYAIEAEITASK